MIPYGDGSQLALWYNPNKGYRVPLIVSLHAWSTDYTTQYPQNAQVANWAIANDWVFIHPNFRGPNTGSVDAMGSSKAIQDIVDAVNYSINNAQVDTNRIYLFGQSGGGYMALLMAGTHPEIWAGVSAWAPITDLMAWRNESMDTTFWNINDKYGQNIDLTCNNDGKSLAQCTTERSPITYLPNAVNLPLDINAGFFDGYTGAVPISHALNGWNLAIAQSGQFTGSEITQMTGAPGVDHSIPSYLAYQGNDPLYYTNTGTSSIQIPVLMRREKGRSRISIFNGTHADVAYWAGLTWLYYQSK
jgi:pimeloyl-ACP methyl ester carboxylesterase